MATRTFTVRLSSEDEERLRRIAEIYGISATAALRKALLTEDFLLEEKLRGAKILVKEGDEVREVIFR